jgi:hypothetical protein
MIDLSDKVLGEVLKNAAHVQVFFHGHPVVPGASMDIYTHRKIRLLDSNAKCRYLKN